MVEFRKIWKDPVVSQFIAGLLVAACLWFVSRYIPPSDLRKVSLPILILVTVLITAPVTAFVSSRITRTRLMRRRKLQIHLTSLEEDVLLVLYGNKSLRLSVAAVAHLLDERQGRVDAASDLLHRCGLLDKGPASDSSLMLRSPGETYVLDHNLVPRLRAMSQGAKNRNGKGRKGRGNGIARPEDAEG